MGKTFTVVIILLDVAAILLLVRPSALLDLWTARRVPASEWDRFVARLVGATVLWLQVARWVGQARSGTLHVVSRSLGILICIYAAAFLIYKFAAFLRSRHDGKRQAARVAWNAVASESEEEARARYRAAWRKYAKLRIAFPLLILGWVPFGYVLAAVFRFFNWSETIWMIIMLAFIPLMPVVGWL